MLVCSCSAFVLVVVSLVVYTLRTTEKNDFFSDREPKSLKFMNILLKIKVQCTSGANRCESDPPFQGSSTTEVH